MYGSIEQFLNRDGENNNYQREKKASFPSIIPALKITSITLFLGLSISCYPNKKFERNSKQKYSASSMTGMMLSSSSSIISKKEATITLKLSPLEVTQSSITFVKNTFIVGNDSSHDQLLSSKILVPTIGEGQTIMVDRGTQLNVQYVNELEDIKPNDGLERAYNGLRYSNYTSLHFHGGHVDPNQDNVFDMVSPGNDTRLYTYDIPSNHLSGTFWLHPHYHGSSAFQTAYGAAKALIVRDHTPISTSSAHSSTSSSSSSEPKEVVLVIGNLVKGTKKSRAIERIYDAVGSNMKVEKHDDNDDSISDDGPISMLLINGELNSVELEAKNDGGDNEVMRVRVVNSAVDGGLLLQWHKEDGEEEDMKSANNDCNCQHRVIARDGAYLNSKIYNESYVLVPPGSRVDYLVQCTTNIYGDQHQQTLLGNRYVLKSVSPEKLIEKDLGIALRAYLGEGTTVHDGVIARIKSSSKSRRRKIRKLRSANNNNEAEVVETVKDEKEDLIKRRATTHTHGNDLLYDIKLPDNCNSYDEHHVCPYNESMLRNKDAISSAINLEWYVENKVSRGDFNYTLYGINHEPYNGTTELFHLSVDRVHRINILSYTQNNGEVATESHPYHMHTHHYYVDEIIWNIDDKMIDNDVKKRVEDIVGLNEIRDTTYGPAVGTLSTLVYTEKYKGISLVHCHDLLHEDEGMMSRYILD